MVDIARFTHFHTYPIKQLNRIFSLDEIEHCLHSPTKSAERFAARFAFKEALFKALAHQTGMPPCPLLVLFKHASLGRERVPEVKINWHALGFNQQKAIASFTHTKNTACSVVVIHDSPINTTHANI